MKKHIGLIIAVILVIISSTFLTGTGKYAGSIAGIFTGIFTSIIIKGITTKKYKSSIIAAFLVAFTGMVLLFFITGYGYLGLVTVHDYFAIEHKLDLQLQGSHRIDTTGIRKYVGVKRNVPFTYFLQINGVKSIKPEYSIESANSSILKDYGLELSDELLADIASSDESWYILLSIGRELKEVKYRYLGYYSDGITSEAIVTFSEEYQDDVVYVYLVNKQLYFWEEDYYVMNGDEKVFLGNNIRLINETIPK